MKKIDINYNEIEFEVEYEYEAPTDPYDPREGGIFEVHGIYVANTPNLIDCFNEETLEAIKDLVYEKVR